MSNNVEPVEQEASNCDVKFIFENGQQIEDRIAVLAAKSRYFEVLLCYLWFTSDMQESKTSRQVNIKDVSPDTFEHLLFFIHSGKMKIPLTESLSQELYVASKKYAVPDLNEECIKFLQSSINVDNVFSMLIWAHNYHVDKIKEKCIAFAVEKGSEMFLYNVAGWKELGKSSLELHKLLITSIINKVSSDVEFTF